MNLFEVSIAFDDEPSLKKEVLELLAKRGYTAVVEAVADGIADDQNLDDSRLPCAVYVETFQEVENLKKILSSAFQKKLNLKSKELSHASWAEGWEQEFRRFDIGDFSVVPKGYDLSQLNQLDGTMGIVIAPGYAFGTGQHATTTSCLLAMSEMKKHLKSKTFLDVGTGTGILAIAALKLGFEKIFATEIDDEVIAAANENMMLNVGFSESGKEAAATFEVRNDSNLTSFQNGSFDVIACNILTEALVPLIPKLVGLLRRPGWLLLSGFPEHDTQRYVDLTTAHGVVKKEVYCERGWPCVVFRGF